jgi:hypothetical protein
MPLARLFGHSKTWQPKWYNMNTTTKVNTNRSGDHTTILG